MDVRKLVKVKPLEWRRVENPYPENPYIDEEYMAETPFGEALIRVAGYLDGARIKWWSPQDDGDPTGRAKTVEAAKAAAQADYEARIYAALIPAEADQ